jgi:hypothetical protein
MWMAGMSAHEARKRTLTMENLYLIEVTTRSKQAEIAQGVAAARLAAEAGVPPSSARRAVAAALVRFGIFLNGSAYHCPDGMPAIGARDSG